MDLGEFRSHMRVVREGERREDLRFGVLASVVVNSSMAAPKTPLQPQDVFPSLKGLMAHRADAEPRTRAEAKRLKQAQGERILANMKATLG